MKKSSFLNRETTANDVDYIASANMFIKENGTIDPNSTLYINALNQYNEGLIKGSVTRLEIPIGFCGYIDTTTGEFRVQPDGDPNNIRSSTPYPNNAKSPQEVPPVSIGIYPRDELLKVGLPGSAEYTLGNADEDDGDSECSEIQWFSSPDKNDITEYNTTSTLGESGTNVVQDVSTCILENVAGINSNKGLAASSSLKILDNNIPPDVIETANAFAIQLFESAGFVAGVVGNMLQHIITYHLFYNIMYLEALLEGALKLKVVWDTKKEEVLGMPIGEFLFVSGGSSGSSGKAPTDLLWKPIRDGGGPLVILLPIKYASVTSVSLYNSSGTLLESSPKDGTFDGDGRSIFRFTHPGAYYGTNITVKGGHGSWTIPIGYQRTGVPDP